MAWKRPISYFRLYQHLRFTEQQGNGEAISLNPPYQFQLLHRHIEITLEITVGSSALHIVNSRTRTGNPDITYTFSNFLILFVFVFLFLFVILILPLFEIPAHILTGKEVTCNNAWRQSANEWLCIEIVYKSVLLKTGKYRQEKDIDKNIFTCLFSVRNVISLSNHEQVCLMRLCFERYFSRHRTNDGGSISRNVVSLNILGHDVINLLYYRIRRLF